MPITSSSFFSNAMQLTLSTGAKVQILSANTMNYQVGANVTSGDAASSQSYAQFAATLGASVPTSGSVNGASYTVPVVQGASSTAALALNPNEMTSGGVTLTGIVLETA